MSQLTSQIAIITGATSGIGEATALLLAARGARVVLSARRAPELAAVAARITAAGGEAIAVAGDVTDEDHARALVAAAVERFGGLDAAINVVGGFGETGAVPDLSLAGWRATLDLNLTSAFLGAKHQLPALRARGGGAIVFVSSFVGDTAAIPNTAAYAAAKAGLRGLAATIAVEHAADRIRANVVIPGGTDTPANSANAPGAGPEVRAWVEGLHALKRIAAPSEIAEAIAFVASPAASFVTGSVLYADGGVSISR